MSKLLIIHNQKILLYFFNKTSKFFDNVCFTMFENTKNSLFESQFKWLGFQNQDDRALIDGIQVPQKASFIWHSIYTVYNQKLKELIQKIKPDELYLFGSFSDVCLLKTIMDMFDDGIVTYVIKDLSVSPHGDGVNDVTFATMKMIIGVDRIISTREIS